MVSKPVSPALAAVLEMRRFSDAEQADAAAAAAPATRSFSVSKTAAVLRLREMQRKGAGWEAGPWDWSLYAVRAANALSDTATAQAREHEQETRVIELEFLHPGFELGAGPSERGPDAAKASEETWVFELGDPLTGALGSDEGLPLPVPGAEGGASSASPTQRAAKWRALIGRALNAALAHDPVRVELVTPLGTRAYERRAEVAAGEDPYAMRQAPTSPEFGRSSFVIRVHTEAAGFGAKIRSFFGGASPLEAIQERWAERILSPPGRAEAPEELPGPRSVAPIRIGTPITLGEVARMGWSPSRDRLYLVREGVRVLPLDEALADAGMQRIPKGWIEAPSLALTVDEAGVVRDEPFETLLAWLHDMQAHTHDEEGKARVVWPERIESVSTVSGRPVPVSELEHWVSIGRELLYVSKHRQREVPKAMQARVVRVWPSELHALRKLLPGASWVPVRALGDRPSMDPVDLTALTQGSFDPVPLVEGAELAADQGPASLRFAARAYLHRFSGATLGSILVLGYGRRLAHTRDHTRTVPGITVVVDLQSSARGDRPSAKGLREHPELLERLYERCAALVEHESSALLDLVIKTGRPWDNPFFREQLGKLSGAKLGLRYRESSEGLRLAWSPHPALGLEVARDDAGQALTLGDVLARVRDVGFLVLRDGDRVYPRLESDDPRFSALRLRRPARPLLERLLGGEVLLQLPFVPEAQPCVGDAEANAGLLTGSRLAQDDAKRAGSDPRARARVQGRLLVARAREADTLGSEGLRTWRRFDPRALSTTRSQSLRALLAERPRPTLAYPGAVSREIEGPVLEVVPAIAALLHAHEGFSPARAGTQIDGTARGAAARPRTRAAGRRKAGPSLPLLRGRVEHEYAIGAITVAADGSSPGIAIWSRGLKVGEVRLPEPLGRVGGRLWLTAPGRLARSRQLQGMAAEVAAELLSRAPYERALLPIEDPRHEALVALIDYLRAKLGDGEGALASSAAFAHLSAAVGRLEGGVQNTESFEASVDASIRRWPLKPGRGHDRLADLIRSALAQKAPVDRAMLSWKIAELEDGRSKIELGSRNKWIKEGEDDPVAAFEAAALVLDAVFRDPEWLKELRSDPDGRLDKHRRWGLRSQFRLLARMLDL